MISLTREIRFSLVSPPAGQTAVSNSWAGWPSSANLAPFLTLRCTVAGKIDARTGYLCNIRELDLAARREVIPRLADRYSQASGRLLAETCLRLAWESLAGRLPPPARLLRLGLNVSPYLSYFICQTEPTMIYVTQQFEFSAAHRLHNDQLSAEENVRLYGKCNNPQGHGHNYLVDVTVRGSAPDECPLVPLPELADTVKRLVIDRLDHRHLNRDVDLFQQKIPSVENIARVIWTLLDGQFSQVQLDCVRVYETPKTWAEYRAS